MIEATPDLVLTPAATAAIGQIRWRQIKAVFKLELRRILRARHTQGFYGLLALTLTPFIIFSFMDVPPEAMTEPGTLAVTYAGLYQNFLLRIVAFLGTATIFSTLFREDVTHKTLHHFLLVPAPRWVLLVGRYLAGLVLTTGLMTFTVALTNTLIAFKATRNGGWDYMLVHGGASQLAAYLGIMVLACLAYGAFFLMVGLLFKSPGVPILVYFSWEFINFLLPSFLKSASVIYPLESLNPIPTPQGSLGVLAEALSPPVALAGLITATVVFLLVAGFQLRSAELKYGEG